MKLLRFALPALLLTAIAAQSNAQSNDEIAIRTLLDRIEQVFAAGDIESAMTFFTRDAVILQDAGPDIAGFDAIRAAYDGMLKQYDVTVDFASNEIVIAGDLAYEQGTYTFKLVDKTSGAVALDAKPRHLHMFKRQADGSWKTWRLMTNSDITATP